MSVRDPPPRTARVKHPALRGHPLYKRGQGRNVLTLPSLAKRVPTAVGGCFVPPQDAQCAPLHKTTYRRFSAMNDL